MTKDSALLLLIASNIFSLERRMLNMNDVWGWATAWEEEVPEEDMIEVATLYQRYGECGLYYWVSERNNRMRSTFQDINRFVDFVRHEEQLRAKIPEENARAVRKVIYTLGRQKR